MTLPDPITQARWFAGVRLAHRTEIQEDYVELISDLIIEHGEARATDLVERFGVTAATVANTLTRLRRAKLTENRPYRAIFLTPGGEAMAQAARTRHVLVVGFLLALGVSRDTAEVDAEGLEHHLSEETLAVMRAFTLTAAAKTV